ncbi:calmodulin-like protein 7 [Olea europaea var. sylvestris]|uniref:calmodulin-like protein 7 n=1 Tax=Olea europaea var. sylvestris TaxID=158386 RepID=UPI000C1D035C|nr:calmodulin-like protein 7 [Olea europaea var. sylvestris]
MLITIFLFALLFILSLIFAFYNIPTTTKFLAWIFQSLSYKNSAEKPSIAMADIKKVKTASANKIEIRSVFATFDKNKDGFITKHELKESLKNIGIFEGEKHVADMFGRVDVNGDGLIDFDEFCELFESISGTKDGEEECHKEEDGDGDGDGDLKEAFDVFDGNKDGLITVEELGMVLSSLGFTEGKKLEECKEMIKQVDMDGDGMVNFEEFKRMMKGGGRLFPIS